MLALLPWPDGFVPDAREVSGWQALDAGERRLVPGRYREQPALLKLAWPQSGVDLRHEWRTLLGLPHAELPLPLAFVQAHDRAPAALILLRIPGQTWADALPMWSLHELLTALDGALAALVHLHDQGVCHADLHAANLLATEDGTRLLDLGLAAPLGTPTAGPGVPAVASPQRLRGLPIQPADDLFSLAATVWTLLSGAACYPGYPAVFPTAEQSPQRAALPQLPEPLVAMLGRWLAVQSDHRPQHARAARAELAAVSASLGAPARASTSAPERLAARLEAAAERPLRLGAFGAVVPDGARVSARAGDGATSWLLERASAHTGPVGWLLADAGHIRCWPLGPAQLDLDQLATAQRVAPLGDPQAAALAACQQQIASWMQALGPRAALAVDAAHTLPTVWRRALQAAESGGLQVWRASHDAPEAAPQHMLTEATAGEVLLGLRAVSGCEVGDAVVRALLSGHLPRKALWPAVAGWLRKGQLQVRDQALVVSGDLARPAVDVPTAAQPSGPHTAMDWLAALSHAAQTATLEWTESALTAWLGAHPPAGPHAGQLRSAWLRARAALGLPLPQADAGLALWLALPTTVSDRLALAELAFAQGDYLASAAHAAAAAQQTHDPDEHCAALRWQAFALTWSGDREAAAQLVSLLAEQSAGDLAVRYLSALLDYYAGRLEAAEAAFGALAREPTAATALVAAAHSGLGLVAHRRGDLAVARRGYNDARQLALSCGDRLRALNMQMNLAVLSHEAGELADALQRYDQAAFEAAQLDNSGARLRIRLNRANLLSTLGMDEDAAAEVEALLPALEAAGWQLLTWNAHQLLAEVARRSGWLQRAVHHHSLAEAAQQNTQAQTERWEWQLEAAQLAAAQGQLAAAEGLLAKLGNEIDKPEWQARLAQVEVTVALHKGLLQQPDQIAQARHKLASAAQLAPDAKPMLQTLIALDAVRLAVAAGDVASAAALARDHHARLTRIRAALPDAYRRRFAASGPLRDAWQWLGVLADVATPTPQAAQPSAGASSLQAILTINRRLSEVRDLSAVLDIVMDAAILLTGAERGFLLLHSDVDERPRRRGQDAEVGPLLVRVARNLDRENLTKPAGRLSHTIACKVVTDGERIVTTDASQDARFAEQASVHSASLRSILCVPMTAQGRAIGCLYVDNRFTSGAFLASHVGLLEALADQAAIAITTATLVQRLQASAAAQAEQQRAIAALNAQLQARLAEAEQALDSARADLSAQRLEVQRRSDFAAIKGESPKLHQLFALMERVREHDVPVLVRGESGTGKELVARAIHYTGKRKRGPFVAINCGALPANLLESELFGHARGAFTGAMHDRRGLFEAAHGGTLLLDEVGEMPLEMQVKLLRVLQSGELLRVGEQLPRKVDVRVVAATHRDLQKMVAQAQFREDLYYRLRVVELAIPPLRERPEDLPHLVEHFLRENRRAGVGKVERLTPRALQLLTQYTFPGNVRQLETMLKSACVFAEGDVLDAPDLAAVLPAEPETRRSDGSRTMTAHQALSNDATLFDMEGALIRERLAHFAGNKRKTAESLGIDRGTLYNRLRAHNLLEGPA